MKFPEGQSAVLQALLDAKHSLAIEAGPSDVGSALPVCTHLEEPLSAVPDSQDSSIESGSLVGEADSDSDDHLCRMYSGVASDLSLQCFSNSSVYFCSLLYSI